MMCHDLSCRRTGNGTGVPFLGKHPIAEVTPVELLTTLRRIERRGAIDTAHRSLQKCGQIFRYAVVTGRVSHDPTTDLHGALKPAPCARSSQ